MHQYKMDCNMESVGMLQWMKTVCKDTLMLWSISRGNKYLWDHNIVHIFHKYIKINKRHNIFLLCCSVSKFNIQKFTKSRVTYFTFVCLKILFEAKGVFNQFQLSNPFWDVAVWSNQIFNLERGKSEWTENWIILDWPYQRQS